MNHVASFANCKGKPVFRDDLDTLTNPRNLIINSPESSEMERWSKRSHDEDKRRRVKNRWAWKCSEKGKQTRITRFHYSPMLFVPAGVGGGGHWGLESHAVSEAVSELEGNFWTPKGGGQHPDIFTLSGLPLCLRASR